MAIPQGDYMPPLTDSIKKAVAEIGGIIQAYLDDIAEKEQAILQMQEAIKSSKEGMSDIIGDFLQTTQVNWVKSICTELYWNYDEPAVRRGICLGLGLKPNVALGNRVYNAFYEMTCSCGEKYLYPIKSRSDERFSPQQFCDKCLAKKEQEAHERYQQQRAVKQAELGALKTMPYVEYLKTEHWQDLRKRSLKRAGYRCQTCNAKGVLHVHHRTYIRRGVEELSDLIVLCADCHSTFHNVHEVTNE